MEETSHPVTPPSSNPFSQDPSSSSDDDSDDDDDEEIIDGLALALDHIEKHGAVDPSSVFRPSPWTGCLSIPPSHTEWTCQDCSACNSRVLDPSVTNVAMTPSTPGVPTTVITTSVTNVDLTSSPDDDQSLKIPNKRLRKQVK